MLKNWSMIYSRRSVLAGTLILILLVAAGGAYAWYALYRPCEVSVVEETSAILISQASMYDQVYQSAINAPPTLVDAPLVTMQQVLMDTQEVVVPVCLQTAKKELLNYMGVVIRAFRAYAAQESDATVKGMVSKSNTYYNNFIVELKTVKKCAPVCFP